jgi:hypothetical protein
LPLFPCDPSGTAFRKLAVQGILKRVKIFALSELILRSNRPKYSVHGRRKQLVGVGLPGRYVVMYLIFM